MAHLDEIRAAVEKESTVVDSAIVLLENLAKLVKETAGDREASLQLAADIEKQTARLSAAVVEGTPSDSDPSARDRFNG